MGMCTQLKKEYTADIEVRLDENVYRVLPDEPVQNNFD